jgi:uncharacterized membrane protein YjgN (DUF898 family)
MMTTEDDAAGSGAGHRAIAFTGTWREYLPIALSNALLTVVTLGIYRFWATARERRYLWSRTRLIDDTLDWTGTGKEMFLGFLIVIAVVAPFFLFIQFLLPALAARGKIAAGSAVVMLFYIAFIYLAGFARFRALRYRLSRTYWHGIRGGSNDPGWNYGGEYLGRIALTLMTFFIVYPWAATRLWNARWNAMSFGPLPFRANLDAEGLKARWAIIYAAPFLGILAVVAVVAAAGIEVESEVGLGTSVVLLVVLIYLGIPLATLHWYAKFYRRAAAETRIGDLSFEFDASTWEWLKLFLGNIALAIVTLGIGLFFWGYRTWSFMIRHTHVYGTIDIADLTQSTTAAPREAEGFADAFDVGAI